MFQIPANTQHIIAWCQSRDIPVVGQLPYSDTFRIAVQSGKTVLEMADAAIEEAMTEMWRSLANQLNIPAESGLAFPADA